MSLTEVLQLLTYYHVEISNNQSSKYTPFCSSLNYMQKCYLLLWKGKIESLIES